MAKLYSKNGLVGKGLCLILLTHVILISVALADTWQVCPSCQYSTIQAAIDRAVDGDTVLVQSGTYVGGVNLSKGLVISGSRDQNFQNPDVNAHPTIIEGGVVLSPFMKSVSNLVVLEHLEITGSPQSAVFQGSDTDLVIDHCYIHHNVSGVFAHSYVTQIGGATTVTNSTFLTNNNSDGPYDTHSHIDIWEHSKIKIENNRLSGQRGTYDYAITVNQVKDIVISNNEIFDNTSGIAMGAASSAAAVEISYNRIHNNKDPLNLRNMSPKIHHNYVYQNDRGMSIGTVGETPEIFNNTVVDNGHIGISMISGSAKKGKFYGNIVGNNRGQGIFMSGNNMGYGKAPEPTEGRFSDNIFFNNWGHVYNSNYYFGSANDESGRGYGGLNGVLSNSNSLQWATRNYVLNPGLASSGLPTLTANSFAIDMGYSGDEFSNEPQPNGGRVNIGADGNTAGAQISPAAPSVSNFAFKPVDDTLELSFDSNAAVMAAWTKLEYFDGNAFVEIPASEFSGAEYMVGFNDRGRINLHSTNNLLVWNNYKQKFPNNSSTPVRIRLTLDHAGRTGQAVATNADLNELQIPKIAIISPLVGVVTHSSQPSISIRIDNEKLSGMIVRFFVQRLGSEDSIELGAVGGNGLYQASWGPNNLSVGDYFLRAVATDEAGNSGTTSQVISVK